jgi:microcompartment protein CcmK/EutM
MRAMGFVLTVGLVLMLAGCSVFQSPTPKSNVAIERFQPLTETDGKGKVKEKNALADSIAMPESWATGSVELEVLEEYNTTANGAQALASRKLIVKRNSDAGPAGEVAANRAVAATELGASLGALLNAVSGQIATTQVRRYETAVDRAQIESDTEKALLKAKVEELESLLAEGEEEAEPAEEVPEE